jgi:hypothetical protein
MSQLKPEKLQVTFLENISREDPVVPRAYTLTHSDRTGDLFLTIGAVYNQPQISGWYTRLMRDEVLAEWQFENEPSLHVHCHVSGGFLFGSAGWRYAIFRQHLPLVLEAFRYGDHEFFESHPELDNAVVWVHFHAAQDRFDRTENWGTFIEYRPNVNNVQHDEQVI